MRAKLLAIQVAARARTVAVARIGPSVLYDVDRDHLEGLIEHAIKADRHATAVALRALVRDTTRPVRDRLADLEALAGRLEGEGDTDARARPE